MKAKHEKSYVAYYRVSTQKQGIDGLGMDGQKAEVVKYLKRLNEDSKRINGPKHILAESYEEVASGGKLGRKQFNLAINSCKESGAKLLYVDISRMARDVEILQMLRRSGIERDDVLNPNMSELMETILVAVRQEEKSEASKRTLRALKQAKLRGTKLGTHNKKIMVALKAKGYKNSGKVRRNKRQDFLATVKDKLTMLREEGKTQAQIAKHLNLFGIEARRGGEWSQRMVSNALQHLEIA